jgi:hypothetical protein
MFDSAQIVVAREWCKVNDCSTVGEFTDLKQCQRELNERACEDFDRPIECDDVRAAGLTLVPSIWPEGPVEDPWPTGHDLRANSPNTGQ